MPARKFAHLHKVIFSWFLSLLHPGRDESQELLAASERLVHISRLETCLLLRLSSAAELAVVT